MRFVALVLVSCAALAQGEVAFSWTNPHHYGIGADIGVLAAETHKDTMLLGLGKLEKLALDLDAKGGAAAKAFTDGHIKTLTEIAATTADTLKGHAEWGLNAKEKMLSAAAKANPSKWGVGTWVNNMVFLSYLHKIQYPQTYVDMFREVLFQEYHQKLLKEKFAFCGEYALPATTKLALAATGACGASKLAKFTPLSSYASFVETWSCMAVNPQTLGISLLDAGQSFADWRQSCQSYKQELDLSFLQRENEQKANELKAEELALKTEELAVQSSQREIEQKANELKAEELALKSEQVKEMCQVIPKDKQPPMCSRFK